MATQKNIVNSLASYFFETNLIEKFFACFEEEISNNTRFQQKLLELSTSESDNCHGNEFLFKHMIENNEDCQFSEIKDKLFKEFNTILSEIMNVPAEEPKHC